LVREESSFFALSASRGSFAEMLLLMAIHFHSNQTNAVGELVCQTLGMKIAIRTNSTSKIRHIFTHEVFTDQVVASHAVRVPVTKDLNATFSGFLPVHCIHQLLKSRAFSKHKVPIKDWIFRQICVASTPLHPVVPALIEVFVNSVLIPASSRSGSTSSATPSGQSTAEQTNEPLSELEIREVFKKPVFDRSEKSSRESTPLKFWSKSGIRSRSASPIHINQHTHGSSGVISEYSITTQILVLYYILLYESVRLTNMRNIVSINRKVTRYSHELFADLPIKFLLQTAERQQGDYGCVFPQLLRHCTTHFPHLCMVQDWLAEDTGHADIASAHVTVDGGHLTEGHLAEALHNLKKCPSKLTLALRKLLAVPPQDAWVHADRIFSHLKEVLDEGTPLQVQQLVSRVWFRLNAVFPRKLWALTANHLNHAVSGNGAVRKRITQDDLVIDPLQVVRCDPRVFRCAPILEIVLYMVRGCLAASRTHLTRHIQDNPIVTTGTGGNGQTVSNDMEREELKNALIATQESAAVQIIMEAGLRSPEVTSPYPLTSSAAANTGKDNVKEVKLICSFLHESFIADPHLAKLVHFQGYPMELLPITVGGVPSMHICLDFAPELLSQPDVEKQAFAIDLISHLSVQYALPKSYSIARLAVNSLSTLISVLSSEERSSLFEPTLASMVRFCKAFPPLIEDVVGLLSQYGRVTISEACLTKAKGSGSPKNVFGAFDDDENEEDIRNILAKDDSAVVMATKIQAVFKKIMDNSVLEKRAY